MPEETYNELLAIMIVVLQDLTKVKFGLKEDSYSGEISGDIAKAKDKVLKKIKSKFAFFFMFLQLLKTKVSSLLYLMYKESRVSKKQNSLIASYTEQIEYK